MDEIISVLIPSGPSSHIGPVSGLDGIRIHHLGIAVESLATAVPVYQRLVGSAPRPQETVADQKVRVVSFGLGGGDLELLEGTAVDSPITRFITKRGPGLHHLALSVRDLPGALCKLESEGVRLIDHGPRIGADNQRIAFIHPASTAGVLIELIEES